MNYLFKLAIFVIYIKLIWLTVCEYILKANYILFVRNCHVKEYLSVRVAKYTQEMLSAKALRWT